MIGKTFGKYRFIEKLGRGGMGTVYKAVDETLDREVAIKVLNPDLADDEVMKRFRAEATTLARLNHPEIATIYEVSRADDELLMVMELVRGETLDQLAQRSGPMPPERAAYLVAQVLGALDHAHRAGIVHRDLKPANLMVTEQGGVKIMDFGIARVAGAEHLTNDGHMMGTPAYMAPEQVMAADVDARADVYACGVVFYRLLTGSLPFEADTAFGMVQKQLSEAPTPANMHRADLPEWCSRVLDRALAKAPSDRYQSAAEFQHALLGELGTAMEHSGAYAVAQLRAQTPLPVHAPTPVAASARPAPSSVSQTIPATIVLKKSHFAAAGAALAIVATVIVVVAVIAFKRTASSAATTLSSSTTAPAALAASSAPAAASVTTPASASAATPALASGAPTATPPAVASTKSDAAAPAKSATAAAGTATAAVVRPAVPALASTYRFEAKAVVADKGKNRERDVRVLLANGTMSVSDRSGLAIFSVPFDSVQGIFISNAKQPMWMSPVGPADAMKVEGGALGFLKGDQNWIVTQTTAATYVLRVDGDHVGSVVKAVEEYSGRKVERIGRDD